MNFDDTPQEAEFRAETRAWLAANAPLREAGDSHQAFLDDPVSIEACKAWQARKSEAGWACLTWPGEYGGRDASAIENLIWGQEESRFRVPRDIFHIGHAQAGPTLIVHGGGEQKERWLPKMIRGEEIWCQLFSEPGAGSDLAGLRTRASREGDHWVVNGQKTWTSGAQWSDWGILLARTDPNVPKHRGLTYFVVDMGTPGIDIRPVRQMWGDADFSEVFLGDVRVPDDHRIGRVGNGWAVALTTLMNERASISGGTVGPAGERLPSARDVYRLARDARIGGARPALDSEAVQERIADYYVRWKGLQYTSYRTLTSLSRGETPGGEGAIGKLVEGRLQQDMASLALDLLGTSGMLGEENGAMALRRWERAYLVASAVRIAGGTDEILRNVIAERVLGLPAEPRIDKEIPFRDIRGTGGKPA
ncbi:MAG: acyl-CoA dehydrogenase family protein [Rhodospirillaceae bacterium]|nr:acyl-CoA dehydrogenase family protein [Rhodospirillaceae bacterium]